MSSRRTTYKCKHMLITHNTVTTSFTYNRSSLCYQNRSDPLEHGIGTLEGGPVVPAARLVTPFPLDHVGFCWTLGSKSHGCSIGFGYWDFQSSGNPLGFLSSCL